MEEIRKLTACCVIEIDDHLTNLSLEQNSVVQAASFDELGHLRKKDIEL